MNVLLINPAWEAARPGAKRYRRAWPPLDLLVAAALLHREGDRPTLIDARADGTGLPEIRTAAEAADLVLLQSTPMDRWQCPDLDWRTLLDLTRLLPKDRLVLAGAHGLLQPELMLRETGAAALIRGEPEVPLAELAAAGGNPRGVRGLSYLDGGRLVHEPDQTPARLNRLPPPLYDLVDLDRYRYELLGRRLAVLETSRGCPFSCIFCLKAMYGPGVRKKPLDLVLSELEDVVGRHRAENVYFIDLEFTLQRRDTEALCQELMRLKLPFKWCCQTRADTVDPDLLARMKEAGCALIHFGVETGSPRLLESIKKKITLDQIRTALAACRRLGLPTACFFLMGLPGETEADREATIRLARELNPTFASFHVAAPYPTTEMGESVRDGEPFPVCLHAEHDLNALARQARRAFVSFYLRPGYGLARLREGTWTDAFNRLKLFWEFVR